MTTNKEIFDRVEAHLLAQKRLACKRDETGERSGTCLYRAPDGTRCAVGVLISDEHYDPKFEGLALSGNAKVCAAVAKSLGIPHLSADTLSMLATLQMIHDSWNPPSRWPKELKLARASFVGLGII